MTWRAPCTRPWRMGTVGRVAERVMLCEKIDALATRGDAHTVVGRCRLTLSHPR
jgi:hypothetical protein